MRISKSLQYRGSKNMNNNRTSSQNNSTALPAEIHNEYKIKFSHDYKKITGTKEAMLLEVININLQNLSGDFIKYDTDSIYELPCKGDYLMLIFQKINQQPFVRRFDLFTTLRRRTDDKEKYYRGAIGRIFQLEKANEAE